MNNNVRKADHVKEVDRVPEADGFHVADRVPEAEFGEFRFFPYPGIFYPPEVLSSQNFAKNIEMNNKEGRSRVPVADRVPEADHNKTDDVKSWEEFWFFHSPSTFLPGMKITIFFFIS